MAGAISVRTLGATMLAAIGAAHAAPGSGGAVAPSFTAEQAAAGRALYAETCASCHGADLEGAGAPPLAGETFLSRWTDGSRAAAELFEIVAKQMPPTAPGSLSIGQGLELFAHMLSVNGYAAGQRPLSARDLRAPLAPPSAQPNDHLATDAGPRTPPLAPMSVRRAVGSAPDDAELLAAAPGNWLLYNRDLHSQRYSPLAQITTDNVDRLRVHCVIQLGEVGSFQTGPVVRNGRMYVTTPHGTYALDLKTCRSIWEHTHLPEGHEPWLANRGVALYRGKVFRGTTDGHLLALDAETGELLWDAWLVDSAKGYFLSAAPIAFDGKVFIGTAGADWGANGRVYALDAESGKLLWHFDVIPTGDEPGAETWGGGAEHGGGSMWSTMTLHVEEGLLYVSVGNPSPDFNGSVRPGDNLYTNSVIALDFRTGKLVRYVQLVPHDVHDWNVAAAPTIYDRQGRSLMAVAGKDGWLYLHDRGTFERIARQEVSTHVAADVAPTPEGVYTCPGPVGGVEWNGVALAPDAGLLFVNSVEWCATFFSAEPRYVEGAPYTGGRTIMDPVEKAKGWLRAFDASTGKPAWVYESPTPMVAAVTPTAGGVLFTGDLDGHFLAFDARTGKVLYRFPTGGAIAGGIVTYELDGRQYVATTSGNSSRTVWKTRGAASIFIFALDEETHHGSTRQD